MASVSARNDWWDDASDEGDVAYADPVDSWSEASAPQFDQRFAAQRSAQATAAPQWIAEPEPAWSEATPEWGEDDQAEADEAYDDFETTDTYDDLDEFDDDWRHELPATGLPGRLVVAGALLGTAGVVALGFALTGGVTFFFDLCFVVICLMVGMSVRESDLFTTGVLPPLLFGVTVAVVSVAAPTSFVVGGDSFVHVFLTGLVLHVGALAFGFAVTLLVVLARMAGRRMSPA